MNYICFVCFSVLLLGCATGMSESVDDIPIISFENENVPFEKEDLICRFISLETSNECLIKRIAQIQFTDDRIFIFDDQSHLFYVFDKKGRFISQIGDYGKGPGEYVLPMQFNIDEKQQVITICDIGQQKLIHYNIDDYHYMYSQDTFRYTYCTMLTDGNMAWYSLPGFDTPKGDKFNLLTTTSDLKNKQYFYKAEFSSAFGMISGSVFHQSEEKTFFHTFFSPTIWEVTNKKLIPTYNISLGNHKLLPLEWLKEEVEVPGNYTATLPNTGYVYAYNVVESSTYINILYFIEKSIYLGFYNKETKKDRKYTYPQFIDYAAIDGGMSDILGVYDDYFITSLSPDILKRHTVQRDDLRVLAEKAQEEDNPILCLFKFR